MAVITINTGLDENYVKLVNDVLRYGSIFLFIHFVANQLYGSRRPNIFGRDIWTMVAIIAMGFAFYNLVVVELIRVN